MDIGKGMTRPHIHWNHRNPGWSVFCSGKQLSNLSTPTLVSCHLRRETWEDVDGLDGRKLRMIADNIGQGRDRKVAHES